MMSISGPTTSCFSAPVNSCIVQHLLTFKLFCFCNLFQLLIFFLFFFLIHCFHLPFPFGLKTCAERQFRATASLVIVLLSPHPLVSNLSLLCRITQVFSAKSLLPPSRGLPALQPTWVSKIASSRFSALFYSFSNPTLALRQYYGSFSCVLEEDQGKPHALNTN